MRSHVHPTGWEHIQSEVLFADLSHDVRARPPRDLFYLCLNLKTRFDPQKKKTLKTRVLDLIEINFMLGFYFVLIYILHVVYFLENGILKRGIYSK